MWRCDAGFCCISILLYRRPNYAGNRSDHFLEGLRQFLQKLLIFQNVSVENKSGYYNRGRYYIYLNEGRGRCIDSTLSNTARENRAWCMCHVEHHTCILHLISIKTKPYSCACSVPHSRCYLIRARDRSDYLRYARIPVNSFDSTMYTILLKTLRNRRN